MSESGSLHIFINSFELILYSENMTTRKFAKKPVTISANPGDSSPNELKGSVTLGETIRGKENKTQENQLEPTVIRPSKDKKTVVEVPDIELETIRFLYDNEEGKHVFLVDSPNMAVIFEEGNAIEFDHRAVIIRRVNEDF